MLADALAAAFIVVLLFVPSLVLANQALSMYTQAKKLVGAVQVGRLAMEQDGEETYDEEYTYTWDHFSYVVAKKMAPLQTPFYKQQVEVRDEDQSVYRLMRLVEAEKIL